MADYGTDDGGLHLEPRLLQVSESNEINYYFKSLTGRKVLRFHDHGVKAVHIFHVQ